MSLQPTTQASFAWVGVMTFVGTRTHGVVQNSRSLSNQDKIPAQAKPAWTGHPHLSSITRMLGWAARHPAILHRLTLEKPPPLHDGDQ